MTTQQEKDQLIDEIMLHVVVTKPLEDIVKGLENGEFRDCDIDWLDTKRMEFVNIAVKALGKDIPQDFKVDKVVGKMNDRNKEMFLQHFRILQKFFSFE